jgi:hypothetical protein
VEQTKKDQWRKAPKDDPVNVFHRPASCKPSIEIFTYLAPQVKRCGVDCEREKKYPQPVPDKEPGEPDAET